MKYRITKKDVNRCYDFRIMVGYCNLCTLLTYESPDCYTTRAEGWAADIYSYGDTAIITGYAPFGNIKPSYETCQKYEEVARKVLDDDSLTWQEKSSILYDKVLEFIEEVTA